MTLLVKKGVLFYPLIIAALPVAFFASENPRGNLLPAEVIATLAVVIGPTIALILLLRLFIKDNVKVAVIVSMILVAFFSYDVIYDILLARLGSISGVQIIKHQYLLPLAGVVALTGISLVLFYRGNILPLIQFAGFVALALVVCNVGRIGLDAWEEPYNNPIDGELSGMAPYFEAGGGGLPDIYYIVLDSYGRADVLEQNFGFNNSGFINALTEQGFYVAAEGRSNYPRTFLSLAASLNMRYMSAEEDAVQLIEENSIVGYLNRIGYRYVHIDSGTTFTKRNRHADVEISLGSGLTELFFNEFSEAFLGHTIAAPVAYLLGFNPYSAFKDSYANRFHFIAEEVRSIPEMPEPTFSFIHILQPHPPWVFDRYGKRPQGSGNEDQKYIDQLFYINKTIESLVEDLLDRSQREPIIIVQGDHGPLPSDGSSFNAPSDRFVLERTAILSAYFLPQYCSPGPYPTITPVNSFRMVFDSCFGTHLGLLEDSSYWAVSEPPIDFSQLSP